MWSVYNNKEDDGFGPCKLLMNKPKYSHTAFQVLCISLSILFFFFYYFIHIRFEAKLN